MIRIIQWLTDIPCNCPLPPSYGYTSTCSGSISAGYEVSYYCNNVKLLVGDESRTCQGNGTWTGSDPSCVTGGVYMSLLQS